MPDGQQGEIGSVARLIRHPDANSDRSLRAPKGSPSMIPGPPLVEHGSFNHRFHPAPEGVPATRRALRTWLEQRDTDAEVTFDALVVATELATNGVLHDGGADVTVHAELENRTLLLTVDTVDLPGPPPPSLRTVQDPFESGRGIPLVRGLSDDFGIEIDGPKRRVWCRIRLTD